MKALGADINNFYNNYFPSGTTHDYDCAWLNQYFVEDDLDLPESEMFDLSEFGDITYWDGRSVISFQDAFYLWKAPDKVSIVIEVDKDKATEVKEKLMSMGFKVI